MPCHVSVWLDERAPHPDPEQERMRYRPGYLVSVYPPRAKERRPAEGFGLLHILDADAAQVSDYLSHWQQGLSVAVVAHSAAQDGYRLRVTAGAPGRTGAAGVTRAQVEAWLGRWNATVYAVAPNSVTFDVRVYSALCSEGFWGADVSGLVWEETYYDADTGVHRVRCDYSARSAWTPARVAARLAERGCTIVSHADYVVEFAAGRAQVREQFSAALVEATERIHDRRRRYLSAAAVDALRTAPGRMLDVTAAQVVAQLRDRAED